MAKLTEQGKIERVDLFLTCTAWFTVNYAAWSCMIALVFQHNLDVAVSYMFIGAIMGVMFCIDMHFYNKKGDILEKNLKEILA